MAGGGAGQERDPEAVAWVQVGDNEVLNRDSRHGQKEEEESPHGQ